MLNIGGLSMIRRLQDADIAGKRVLVRVDFNVPMANGQITDDTRLKAALPTIALLRREGAKVILAAHFGRPKGHRDMTLSLAPVATPLSELIDHPVKFVSDCVGADAEAASASLGEGDVLLLENTRFHAGEEQNDPGFSAQLAKLADVYVNDAFSAAHRAHASTEGVARILPAYAGLSLQRELDYVTAALEIPPARFWQWWAAPKSPPSSICLRIWWPRWTGSSSAGLWPIPSWPPRAMTWAPAFMSATCWIPRAKSLRPPMPRARQSCCRWTVS
jgi:hypothetical protein